VADPIAAAKVTLKEAPAKYKPSAARLAAIEEERIAAEARKARQAAIKEERAAAIAEERTAREAVAAERQAIRAAIHQRSIEMRETLAQRFPNCLKPSGLQLAKGSALDIPCARA